MSDSPCFVCGQAVGAERPGARYDAVGRTGMRLEGITVCHACAAAPHDPARCAHCRKAVGAGATFDVFGAASASGRAIAGLPVCFTCAVPLGPSQNLTETFKEDLRAHHGA